MNSIIVKRQKIQLNEVQNKMLVSSWGEDILNNSTVEKIIYVSDGLKIKGYLAYPKNIEKKYPCVIWNRGGYKNEGAIDIFTARGMFGQIASWGYVVFASQYRGSSGSDGVDELGGSDVNDILNLIPLANETDFADTNNWGIEGWSRGGMMTYITLLKSDVKFKAAIFVGGISNLHCSEKNNRYRKMINEKIYPNITNEKFEKECLSRSAINFVTKLPKDTNYLLLHGTNDELVEPEDTIDIARKFQLLNYNYRLIMLEGGDHFLKKHRNETAEFRKMWYKKYL